MANDPRLAIESIAGQRPYQEDAVLAETLEDGRILVAVADGMGGHAAGEVASAIALQSLTEALSEGQSLADAFSLANARVFDKAKEPGKQGMGTTLVAALIDDGHVEWANVGDSRGYVISDGRIRQHTQDHSFVAEAVKRGQSEAEAMAGPWKDALTRSIGTEEAVEVDVFGPMPLTENSALVVCSDGLYKTLTDADLLRIYSKSGGPRGAAQLLVSSAFESGSDDNISVAIVEVGEVRRELGEGTMPLDYVPPADMEPFREGSADDAELDSVAGAVATSAVASEPESRLGPRPTPAAKTSRPPERSGVPVAAIVAAVVIALAVLAMLAF